jgi:two-component system cell cycle response regulator
MEKKILTIDDSQTVRAIISKHLSQFSVKMFEADNGEAGVARAREGFPDLILLDYNMPVMDGYHTLIELKTDPKLKSIPVVMVTTETSKEMVVKLLKLGLNDYIAKPFTREILLRKINPILKLYDGDAIPEAPPAPAKEAPTPTPTPTATLTKSTAKPVILAIDDKASILQLLTEYIDEKFQLITADSGKAAIKAISSKNFDYVFLDLSLPDMSGLDFLNVYLKDINEGASAKKVIAMTLRSAQSDIRRAIEAGIKAFLYKPFTRVDVVGAIEQVVAAQNEVSVKKMFYLVSNGKTKILECPAEKSSKFQIYAEMLASDIIREIDRMAEEGTNQLIVSVGEGFLNQPQVCNDFIAMMKHARELQCSVRLVADSPQSRTMLKQFSETSNLPTDVSVECALSSI